jgi:riboflavin synthase
VRLSDRMGGHMVQGHVDGRAEVSQISPDDNWTVVRFTLDPHLMKYVVEKGSICVDGVSLTVANLFDDGFSVSLIPTTLQETTLGQCRVGDTVNIEVDVIAKYVERLSAGWKA